MQAKRRWIILLGVVATLLLLAIGYMWGYDIWRHRTLTDDFDRAVEMMEAQIASRGGYTFESGCHYQPGKLDFVGKGEKWCVLGAAAVYDTKNLDSAKGLYDRLPTFAEGFSIARRTKMENPQNPLYVSGVVGLVHNKTEMGCSLLVTFHGDSTKEMYEQTEVEFTCDDRSWFAKTFQRKNSIFSYW